MVAKFLFLCSFLVIGCRSISQTPETEKLKPASSPGEGKKASSSRLELKNELTAEANKLCEIAKQLGNDESVKSIHEDFSDLSNNLKSLNCPLFVRFVHSKEFDKLFAQQLQKHQSSTTANEEPILKRAAQSAPNKKPSKQDLEDESKDQNRPQLANPDLVPKLLITMGVFGYFSAARMKYVQNLGVLAFFQFTLSTVSLYLSYRTGTNTQTELENEGVPWVLFLNGVMGAIGSTTVIKNGYTKLRKWRINPESKGLDYNEFTKQYSELYQSDINKRKLTTLDDVAITRFAKNHNMDPKVVKGTVSGVILGIGSIMAAFAIKQLYAGSQELKNNYNLTGIAQALTYEEIFEPSLNKLISLKSRLNQFQAEKTH